MRKFIVAALLALSAGGVQAQGIETWSPTPASNNAAVPYGWPVGMNPSDVKLSARQMMTSVRNWYDDAQWIDGNYGVNYVSSTGLKVGGNRTSIFHLNRRVKAYDGTNYVYGTIVSSSYVAPSTTVIIAPDSGTLNSNLNRVWYGAIGASNTSIVSATIGITSATIAESISTSLVPAGVIMPFAGSSSTVPATWLLAAGQSVSRTGVYANLFAAIGTTYGTADANSFNVPDMRGRVAAGLDNMGGTAASRVSYTTAGISGTILGSAGGDQRMQQHNHAVTDPGHKHAFNSQNTTAAGGGGYALSNASDFATGLFGFNNVAINTATTGITVDTSGTGVSQNMQPTMMLNYIIKY